jgi:hypothetical protein
MFLSILPQEMKVLRMMTRREKMFSFKARLNRVRMQNPSTFLRLADGGKSLVAETNLGIESRSTKTCKLVAVSPRPFGIIRCKPMVRRELAYWKTASQDNTKNMAMTFILWRVSWSAGGLVPILDIQEHGHHSVAIHLGQILAYTDLFILELLSGVCSSHGR